VVIHNRKLAGLDLLKRLQLLLQLIDLLVVQPLAAAV